MRGGTYSFGLESLDSLDVCADVVRDGFKVTQDFLRFIDDALVLQNGAVVRKVYSRWLGI